MCRGVVSERTGRLIHQLRSKEGRPDHYRVPRSQHRQPPRCPHRQHEFIKLQVNSEQLLDAIRPAVESIDYKLPETVNNEYKFRPPLFDLFFAQGRIIEIIKHRNMEPIKNRLLRAFVTVLHVVLESLNVNIHEMASKKIINFDHLWAPFPSSSFLVHEVREATQIS